MLEDLVSQVAWQMDVATARLFALLHDTLDVVVAGHGGLASLGLVLASSHGQFSGIALFDLDVLPNSALIRVLQSMGADPTHQLMPIGTHVAFVSLADPRRSARWAAHG